MYVVGDLWVFVVGRGVWVVVDFFWVLYLMKLVSVVVWLVFEELFVV